MTLAKRIYIMIYIVLGNSSQISFCFIAKKLASFPCLRKNAFFKLTLRNLCFFILLKIKFYNTLVSYFMPKDPLSQPMPGQQGLLTFQLSLLSQFYFVSFLFQSLCQFSSYLFSEGVFCYCCCLLFFIFCYNPPKKDVQFKYYQTVKNSHYGSTLISLDVTMVTTWNPHLVSFVFTRLYWLLLEDQPFQEQSQSSLMALTQNRFAK